MNTMFDAVVIRHAVAAMRRARITAADKNHDFMMRSRRVVEEASVIRVSCIAWMEIARGMKTDDERRILADLERKASVEAVDAETVEFALALQRARVKKWTVDYCRECGNKRDSHPCPGCGNMLSDKSRFNDYLIAASAHLFEDVDVLYTFDKGILSMQERLRPSVREPPIIEQASLFDLMGDGVEVNSPEQTSAPKEREGAK